MGTQSTWGVTGKMNRMVLLCMLILSMVSLPTSLARKECTDFLEEALDVLGSAYKTMGPALQDGMNAVMENRKKERITDVCRPHDPIPLVHAHHLVQIPGQGVGGGAAPVTSWVDNGTLMV